MNLAKLADLAKLAISKPQDPVPTVSLWTSRRPILVSPSPIPDQHCVPITTHSSPPIFPGYYIGAYANESGDVYFYGGVTASQSNELYRYSIADNTITPLQCWGACPGNRSDYAMALVGSVIAIHGGALDGYNDRALYLLNLVTREWSRITTSGDAPEPCVDHAMAAVGTTIYVFGGSTLGFQCSNKLWAFSLDALGTTGPTWELVESTSQTRPTARYSTTLAPYQGQLILFGGDTGPGNDVWSFDLKNKSWSELECTGDIPPPRSRHTAVILDDVMYIIGGVDWEGIPLRGIFALKILERRWFGMDNTYMTPSLRYRHASTCIGTKIFIFGGHLEQAPEERGIHILDTKFIENTNLHTPARLRELDVEFQLMLTQAKLSARVKELEYETGRLKRSLIISHILQYPSKMDSLAHLQRADAQMIVDFLADELGSQDNLQSNADKRHILHLLTKLAKIAQTFPKCTELSDVQCTLTIPVNDEGGYGFIYKGVFREQPVCVKAVRFSGSGTRGKMLRAQAGEVVLGAHVSHPNVIPLYGAYLSSEEIPRICIVCPWMENGDLAVYLRKFPNTPKIPLMCDMAAGLDFIHDMDIIHADLKASNVLISRSEHAMLADLGVATVLHTNVGATTARDFAGTNYWQAPEILIAEECPAPTKEGDMWGFACVCYEMLTGEPPFRRHYHMFTQLLVVLIKGNRITPLRPKVDSDPIDVDGESWVPLAERCWNYDPSERPSAAEALRFLTELNVPDDRPSMDEELATFKIIRDSRVKVEIDYSHVLSVVQNG